MAYKDKEKQKQASKERQRRYRVWKASGGVTKGVTSEGVTSKALLKPVISKAEHHVGASQIKDVRALHKEIGQQTKPEQANVIPEQGVTPEQGELLEEIFGKDLLETGLPDDKPRTIAEAGWKQGKGLVTTEVGLRAIDPDVQTIWDRRNAQGQAGGYSAKAQSEDYPQTQRPHIKL